MRILKPGGHLVVIVPDEDMYEQGVFPSTFNTDHKWTFTASKTSSWSSRSINLIDLIKSLGGEADVIKIEQLTGSYRYQLPRIDQTITPIGESAIEFIIRKRSQAELEAGGCISAERQVRSARTAPTNQVIFDSLGRIRDARITGSPDSYPQTVVIPFATYSPWNESTAFIDAYTAIRGHTLVDLYRCFDLWNLIKQVRDIPGDVLEVGVWRGGTGCLLGLAMKDTAIGATLYLADTFRGVVKTGKADTSYKGGEHAETSPEIVQILLTTNGLNDYTILEGVFPEETSSKISAECIRFCHIEVDVYQSAKDIFEWLWPRLSVGGVVVFGDYGLSTCPGVTKFVNELVGRAGLVFVHNLNGHAVLVKTGQSPV
jgi:O-methyltransferase